MDTDQFVIGITGGSGVGKTTLIDILYDTFQGQISTLSLDDYYKPKQFQLVDGNGKINFDLPTALNTYELENDLRQICNQKSIKQKVYHFNHPDKLEEYRTISPNKILLVEGLFVMYYPFVKSKLDYSVFLSVDQTKQLERRLKRDVEERNYNKDEILYQWKEHVVPAFENFVLPYKKEADLIITNNLHFDQNLDMLLELIATKIK